MELGGVGLVMLVVVFIYYLRMVGRRMASRQRKDPKASNFYQSQN